MGVVIFVIFFIIWVLWFFEKEAIIMDEENQKVTIRSRFSRFGDPTAPDIIIISDKYVEWRKNKGFGELWLSSDSVKIPSKRITGVHIHSKLIGCAIEITTQGFSSIYARHFRQSDAELIRDALMS